MPFTGPSLACGQARATERSIMPLDAPPAPDPLTLPMHKDGLVVVVIETPRGSGNKLKYDTGLGVYRLDRALPAGLIFPFDFGFIPQTLADDGDPLDAIV